VQREGERGRGRQRERKRGTERWIKRGRKREIEKENGDGENERKEVWYLFL
jgi:hypothetical protein